MHRQALQNQNNKFDKENEEKTDHIKKIDEIKEFYAKITWKLVDKNNFLNKEQTKANA